MLAPGARLGVYEILDLLGVGGMGEVYRARDHRLGREVALKVLPADYASDSERVARFEREAHVLAALNHPHIASIYGVEDSGGTSALVLELVKGETLADRIARGPVPLDEALTIARQIADALEAAHSQRIIHRDLKPSNVVLTGDGRAKVLDFGLARLTMPAGDDRPAASLSPTISSPARMTNIGVVLGTAAYMSPEQAKGLDADERSDIWALGGMLYELLTGKRPFDGDSVAQVLARVLEREPDWQRLPPATPPAIRRLIVRCLQKNRDRRIHHVADVRLEIEDALAGTADGGVDSVRAGDRPARLPAVPLLAIAALCIASTVAAVMFFRSSEPRGVVRSTLVTLTLGTGPRGGIEGLAMSPDGRRVAYAADGVHLRSLDRVDAESLRGAENGAWPSFSPDSQSVAFFVPAESAIKRVTLAGGDPALVARTDGGQPRGLSWSPDGTIVFATNTSAGLWRVAASGGEPERLTTLVEGDASSHEFPAVLPEGRAVLFAKFRGASARIAVVALDTREVRDLVPVGSFPRFSPSGHLLYESDGALWAAPFSTDRLQLAGSSRVNVVNGVAPGLLALSADGALVYVTGTPRYESASLVWIDRQGREEALPLDSRPYGTVRVAPHGRAIVADVRDGENAIWVSDLSRPGWTRISAPDPGSNESDWFPKWTPDSTRVVFARYGAADPALFMAAADGSGRAERLLSIKGNQFIDARVWSPDGQLLFSYGNPTAVATAILSMPATDGSEGPWRSLAERPGGVWASAMSPDGKWIVTESPAAGRMEVYIERFPELRDRQLVSVGTGGENAVWSPDGRELFYRVGSGAMMAVAVQTQPTLSLGPPRRLFDLPGHVGRIITSRGWDIAPDGRFLMIKTAAPATTATDRRVVLVQNWSEELTRLVARN